MIVAARFTGNPDNAEEAYKPSYGLGPIAAIDGSPVPIQDTSDGREALAAKGDHKRFGVVGLRRFDVDSFLQVVDLRKTNTRTGVSPTLPTRPLTSSGTRGFPKTPDFDSARSSHDIGYWQ